MMLLYKNKQSMIVSQSWLLDTAQLTLNEWTMSEHSSSAVAAVAANYCALCKYEGGVSNRNNNNKFEIPRQWHNAIRKGLNKGLLRSKGR
jgi:hypothetical protein